MSRRRVQFIQFNKLEDGTCVCVCEDVIVCVMDVDSGRLLCCCLGGNRAVGTTGSLGGRARPGVHPKIEGRPQRRRVTDRLAGLKLVAVLPHERDRVGEQQRVVLVQTVRHQVAFAALEYADRTGQREAAFALAHPPGRVEVVVEAGAEYVLGAIDMRHYRALHEVEILALDVDLDVVHQTAAVRELEERLVLERSQVLGLGDQ